MFLHWFIIYNKYIFVHETLMYIWCNGKALLKLIKFHAVVFFILVSIQYSHIDYCTGTHCYVAVLAKKLFIMIIYSLTSKIFSVSELLYIQNGQRLYRRICWWHYLVTFICIRESGGGGRKSWSRRQWKHVISMSAWKCGHVGWSKGV